MGDSWQPRVRILIGFGAVVGLLIVIRAVQPSAFAWPAIAMVILYLALVVAMALLLAAFTKPPQPLWRARFWAGTESGS